MKKETVVVTFYVLYFIWLLTITYLTNDLPKINIFTGAVTFFYFLFLREKGDFRLFLASSIIPVIVSILSFTPDGLKFNTDNLRYFPIWLGLAWGTTAVALKKLYSSVSR
jgi:hypothetical protein